MKSALLVVLLLGGLAQAASNDIYLYNLLKSPSKHQPYSYNPETRDRFLPVRVWVWNEGTVKNIYISRSQISPELFSIQVNIKAFPLSSIDPKAKKLFIRHDELLNLTDVGYLLRSGKFKGFYALISRFEKASYLTIMPVQYEVVLGKYAFADIGMDRQDQANEYPIRGYVVDRSFFCMLKNVECL